jgi:predicted DNA-binding transcriptional regulator AlpA
MTTFTPAASPRLRRLLKLNETAELLRKTPDQLRWMIKTKSAPPHAKVGGRIMFDADEVATWLDEQFTEAS